MPLGKLFKFTGIPPPSLSRHSDHKLKIMAFYNGRLTLSSEQFLVIPNPCGFKVATFVQGSTEFVKYMFDSGLVGDFSGKCSKCNVGNSYT